MTSETQGTAPGKPDQEAMDRLRDRTNELELIWNPDASAEAAPIDDRYTTASRTFVIPIAYTPGVEVPVD